MAIRSSKQLILPQQDSTKLTNKATIQRIQMLQNSNKRKLRNITNQIDSELTKIDKLLTKLAKQKPKPLNPPGPQNRPQLHDHYAHSASTHILDKFKETAYIHEEQTYQYAFTEAELQKEEEEMLLENQQNNSHYIKIRRLTEPLSIEVQTKSNWIQKYLDCGDCEVDVAYSKGYVEIIGVQNGLASCFGKAEGLLKLEVTQIYQQDSLRIRFSCHTQAFRLPTKVDGRSQVYQMTLQGLTRFVLRCQRMDGGMSRILIIKQGEAEEGMRFQIAWGSYFKDGLTELITLEAGNYLIVPLATAPLPSIQLFFDSPATASFQVAEEEPLKTRNILMQCFAECPSQSYQPSCRDIQQQYTRNVYLDVGVVVETYENIYAHEAKFQDEEQNEQDISLLFAELYTPHQLRNRLRPREKVVKFFGIEQKPAKLFVPRKVVVMGSKVMQTLKVHSVFK